MRLSPHSFQISLRCICCVALIVGSVPLTAREPYLSKPSQEWTEAEALNVLNDSPWAKTITTSTQDFQCDYEHPAVQGTFEEKFAREADSISPAPPAKASVKPDEAEYVVRLLSVKPMQSAAARLGIINREKWAQYDDGIGLPVDAEPTNLQTRWYNPADEITISVVLKHPGAGGESFREYAFHSNGPGEEIMHVWPCAAVKTAIGATTAVTGGPARCLNGKPCDDITLSFPSTLNGELLISHPNEKLEFRFIANQRVFEATFYVNVSDVFNLDGTATVMYIPHTYDKPSTTPRPAIANNL